MSTSGKYSYHLIMSLTHRPYIGQDTSYPLPCTQTFYGKTGDGPLLSPIPHHTWRGRDLRPPPPHHILGRAGIHPHRKTLPKFGRARLLGSRFRRSHSCSPWCARSPAGEEVLWWLACSWCPLFLETCVLQNHAPRYILAALGTLEPAGNSATLDPHVYKLCDHQLQCRLKTTERMRLIACLDSHRSPAEELSWLQRRLGAERSCHGMHHRPPGSTAYSNGWVQLGTSYEGLETGGFWWIWPLGFWEKSMWSTTMWVPATKPFDSGTILPIDRAF